VQHTECSLHHLMPLAMVPRLSPLPAQTAQAWALACIAEAQALTVLRAVQKGNAPSLIASLATDASAAFSSAAGTAGGVVSGAKADSKFVLYAEYQAAAMEALALAFAGVFCSAGVAICMSILCTHLKLACNSFPFSCCSAGIY
jgi:hypothetical protein